MKKLNELLMVVMVLLGSFGGRIYPVIAEEDDNTGDVQDIAQEIIQDSQEASENTEPTEEPESGEEEETVSWTLRYDLGEGVHYGDERTLEAVCTAGDSDPMFTLYDLPVREGFAPDGWRVCPENDSDNFIICNAGDHVDPVQFYENGGVIIAEPLWLKLFTVTVIYDLNCQDAHLAEPYAETTQILFENNTRKSFDIRLNASAEGKVFVGWTEDIESGVLLNNAEAVQDLADRIIDRNLSEITLYGVWENIETEATEYLEEEKKYHVVYRSAGTDCVFTDSDTFEWEQGLYSQHDYHINDEVVINQEVTCKNLILIGWALSPQEASEEILTYHNGDTLGRLFENTDEDLILYAVWKTPELYSLRCYVNGGVVKDTPANKKGIATKTIIASEFDSISITRNGYNFEGWFSDSRFKKQVTAETFIENPKNMNLYAKWSPKIYRIYFDLNDNGEKGAVIAGADQSVDENNSAVKDGFVFNKKQKLTPKASAPGYTFLGWAPDPNAVSAKYSAGKSYKNYSGDGEDVTLYAVWKPKTYKLKIYVNGGKYGDVSPLSLKAVKIKNSILNTTYTVEDSSPLMYVTMLMNDGDSAKEGLNESFFTRLGYTFAGWYKDKNLRKKIDSVEYFQQPGNYTVYAKWEPVQYTVRLHANGENAYLSDTQGNHVPSLDQTVTYNKKTKINAVPVKEGYTFLGWSLNPQASVKSDVNYAKDKKYKRFGAAIPEADDTVDLYAVWKKKAGTIENGLNNITYSGVKMAVYMAEEGYSLQMLSAGEGKLKGINSFDSPNLNIAAVVNANYFQMRQDTVDPYGTHYGVEQTYDGVDLAPKRSGLICYYQLNDGEVGWMRSDEYYLQNSDVIFACTPYSVLRHSGQTINVRSTLLTSKENAAAYQTMVMRVHGVWCLVVSRTQTYPRVMLKYAESLNAEEAILMDGGGSSQMLVYADNTYNEVRNTGRAIPNVLCIAKEK